MRDADDGAFFLERIGMTGSQVQGVLCEAVETGGDFAELYCEHRVGEELVLEAGVISTATKDVSCGAGVRVAAADRVGYAYTEELSGPALRDGMRAARALTAGAKRTRIAPVQALRKGPLLFVRPRQDLYPLAGEASLDAPLEERVALLGAIDVLARRYDHRIRSVRAVLTSERRRILIINSDGVMTGDTRPLVRLMVECIAQERGISEKGMAGGGGRVALSCMTADQRHVVYARTAADRALRNLRADYGIAGTMTVVFGPGGPGAFVALGVGHLLEGDTVRRSGSIFEGCFGKRVISPLCTVVDDGTLAGKCGSLNVDDEGTPTGRTVLIEGGVLKGYMQDRVNAQMSGLCLTGNGRRESFRHPPIPRMTNLFLAPGEAAPGDVIHSVERGLYVAALANLQVDISTGKFVLYVAEGYAIERGRLTYPVKGAMVIGRAVDALGRVVMIGNDLLLDEGNSTDGKAGQSVPMGVGMPTVRVDGLTVGFGS